MAKLLDNIQFLCYVNYMNNQFYDPFSQKPQNQPSKKPPPTAFGVVSFVASLSSAFLSVLLFVIGIVIPHIWLIPYFLLAFLMNIHILGLVFGIIQLNFFKKRDPSRPKGMPVTGVILSSIFLGVSFVFMIVVMVTAISYGYF